MAFKLKSGSRPAFKNMGSTPAKNMTTGSYSQSFESPAKQRSTKGGEGQDQDKIFNNKGEHVGNYVNGKKVMLSREAIEDAQGVTSNIKTPKVMKDGPKKQVHGVKNPGNWQPHQFKKKKSPAKQGVITPKKLTPEEEKENIQNRNKNKPGPWDNKGIKPPPPHPNPDEKLIIDLNRKRSKPGPWDHSGIITPPKKQKSPAKQTDTTWADGSKKSARDKFNDRETAIEQRKADLKDNQKSPYWYKIDGKKATRAQYIKYNNVPGKMEGGGKQTNNPDVYGRKANNHGRGPKTK